MFYEMISSYKLILYKALNVLTFLHSRRNIIELVLLDERFKRKS